MRNYLLIGLSLVMMLFVVTGCYEVVYTVEHKGDSCIKFEDAQYWDEDLEPEAGYVDACLGDDEIEEADVFTVVVDSAVSEITVSLKAGKDKATDIPVPTDGVTEVAVGSFTVMAGEIDEEPEPDPEVFTYQIAVGCDDIPGGKGGTAALSNITLCFGEAIVLSPEEGTITIERATDLDEPGEPVEEE
jgi:hypothetical protein